MLEAGCENERVCAYVQNIGRTGEQAHFCTIEELINAEVDMFTTVFVGNSQSEIITLSDGQKRLITKRGYKIESDDE